MQRLTKKGAQERAKWLNFLTYLRERIDTLKLARPAEAVNLFDHYFAYVPLIPTLNLESWMKKLAAETKSVSYRSSWYSARSIASTPGGSELGGSVKALSDLSGDFADFAQSLASSLGYYQRWISRVAGRGGQ